MTRFDTPVEVAAVLARHARRRITRLLDPAVGTGILVRALASRLKAGEGSALCIDKDAGVLGHCRRDLDTMPSIRARYLNANFLNWNAGQERFDCIIMNPPFDGTGSGRVKVRLSDPNRKGVFKIPVEAGFVLKAVKLLQSGGQLLAILPSSVIVGEALTWLRQQLMQEGRIRYVHELPHYTFRNVESRVYLMIFEKGKQCPFLRLSNHDLVRPHTIQLRSSALDSNMRLDFAFCSSTAHLIAASSRKPLLRWTPLGECVSITRGRGDSPHDLKSSVHTTDFGSDCWQFSKGPSEIARDASPRGIRYHDLLMKRVGRGVARTLMINNTHNNKRCSDCVIVLRPIQSLDPVKLLLAIRVLLESIIGPSLVERGTGARYITELALRSLRIPTELWRVDPSLFRRYRRLVEGDGNLSTIREIESKFRAKGGLLFARYGHTE